VVPPARWWSSPPWPIDSSLRSRDARSDDDRPFVFAWGLAFFTITNQYPISRRAKRWRTRTSVTSNIGEIDLVTRCFRLRIRSAVACDVSEHAAVGTPSHVLLATCYESTGAVGGWAGSKPSGRNVIARTSRPLRIAVLSPIAWRTPPRHYGPWELFSSLLSEGLVALGHDVTLFATADSVTSGRLRSTVACGWSENSDIEPKVAECIHIADVFERSGDFDIIHNGFDFLPLSYSKLVSTPVVTTIHGFSSERIVAAYERYNSTSTYVAISDANRHPRLSYAATIHHGIDVDAFPLGTSPSDYLLFFGRIHPDKGAATAIEVARRSNRPLIIAGIIQDERYFRDEVAPHIDGDRVRYVGPVDTAERAGVLGRAHALLHLIDFEEPFGYSVVESMACGTPVIAFTRGSMAELIDQGMSGTLVSTLDEAVEAVEAVAALDRAVVRAVTVKRFDHAVMVQRYDALYATLVR
jgi:glycosyltransferase involved in cell wall biosynthesis